MYGLQRIYIGIINRGDFDMISVKAVSLVNLFPTRVSSNMSSYVLQNIARPREPNPLMPI